VLASMRDGFWQKFTVKAGDDGAGRTKGKRRDEKKPVMRKARFRKDGGQAQDDAGRIRRRRNGKGC
jgi:hypothetical protein